MAWRIDELGGFEGTAFELTQVEYAAVQQAYPSLEWPGDLAAADQFFVHEFEKTPAPTRQAALGRLHAYLAAQNRKAAALQRQIGHSKPRSRDESCYFDEHRLVVANGFKAELLELAQGNERAMTAALNKCVERIPIELAGASLRKSVKAALAKQLDWDRCDERKTVAVERRGTAQPRSGDSARNLMRSIVGGDRT